MKGLSDVTGSGSSMTKAQQQDVDLVQMDDAAKIARTVVDAQGMAM